MTIWRFAAVCAFLAAFHARLSAQPLEPIAILTPSDVPTGYSNGFGNSVDISGRLVVIGAPYDPWYNAANSGAVYVFRRFGPYWIEAAKLTVEDDTGAYQLGWSVAVEGDRIVASAPSIQPTAPELSGPGAVYVFRRDSHATPDDFTDDTWLLEARLIAPNAHQGQTLGTTVGISGDTIVLGNPQTGWQDLLGAAEVFRWDGKTWTHEASLVGSTAEIGNGYGASVDINGERIVVGEYFYDRGRGAAYVFSRSSGSWIEEAVLTASDGRRVHNFGFAVSVFSNRIGVGAPGTGATYLFDHGPLGEWHETTKLTFPDDAYTPEFGIRAVSIFLLRPG